MRTLFDCSVRRFAELVGVHAGGCTVRLGLRLQLTLDRKTTTCGGKGIQKLERRLERTPTTQHIYTQIHMHKQAIEAGENMVIQ